MPGRTERCAGELLNELRVQFDIVERDTKWKGRYAFVVLPENLWVDQALASRLQTFIAAGGAVIAAHTSGLLDPIPLSNVTVRVNLPLGVSTAKALYAGRELPVRRDTVGGVEVLVPLVDIHEVVCFELS